MSSQEETDISSEGDDFLDSSFCFRRCDLLCGTLVILSLHNSCGFNNIGFKLTTA